MTVGRAGGSLSVELALLGVLALLWGSSYLFIKVAVADIPPLTLIACRVAIAAVLLVAVLRWQGGRLPRGSGMWGRLLLQAFLNSIGAWTLLAFGQRHVDSALASVLNSTSPIFVFLITALLTRHEDSGALRFAGAGLGLAGVVIIVGTDALAGFGTGVAGQLAVLASAVLYAGAAIHGRRFGSLSPTATAAGTMICAAAVLVPASLLHDAPWRLAPGLTAVLATGALGLLCTGVALIIYFRLVRTLGSIGVASQAYLRAGVGVALGMIVLGEQPAVTVALGLAAAIAGVALINLPARRAQRAVAGWGVVARLAIRPQNRPS